MHDFYAVPIEWIPTATKQYISDFDKILKSNDGLLILLDNAHPRSTYDAWMQWGVDGSTAPASTGEELIDYILSNSRRYSVDEVLTEKADPLSVWYENEVLL